MESLNQPDKNLSTTSHSQQAVQLTTLNTLFKQRKAMIKQELLPLLNIEELIKLLHTNRNFRVFIEEHYKDNNANLLQLINSRHHLQVDIAELIRQKINYREYISQNVMKCTGSESTYKRYLPEIGRFEILAKLCEENGFKSEGSEYEMVQREDSTFGKPVPYLIRCQLFRPCIYVDKCLPAQYEVYLIHGIKFSVSMMINMANFQIHMKLSGDRNTEYSNIIAELNSSMTVQQFEQMEDDKLCRTKMCSINLSGYKDLIDLQILMQSDTIVQKRGYYLEGIALVPIPQDINNVRDELY
eukprot:403341962